MIFEELITWFVRGNHPVLYFSFLTFIGLRKGEKQTQQTNVEKSHFNVLPVTLLKRMET